MEKINEAEKRPNVDGRIGQFPDRLKEAIGSESIRSFSKRSKSSESVIRKYLSGKSEPTRLTLIAMADAADVSVQWLAAGNAPKEKEKIVQDFGQWVSFRYVHSLILDTFKRNKRDKKHNAFAVFLAYLDEQQKESLLDVSLSVALLQERTHHVIHCKEKTLMEIAEDITESTFRTRYDAFCAISDVLINNDEVFVFCDLSKIKDNDKKGFHRAIIKEIERDALDEKISQSDVIFLDSPSFLEKNWESLGVYLSTNILNGSSFFI